MKVDVLLGLQWGDEGKGKIVDVVTPKYDIIARFQGGPNAGHTLIFDDKKYVLHTIPSGIFRDETINVIGNGVVIDPIIIKEEIDKLEAIGIDVASKLLISKKAHLIVPTHKILDKYSEEQKGKNKIGSTLKGIGPTYMDKTGRNGLRMGDSLSPNFREKYDGLQDKHKAILGDYDYDALLTDLEKKWFEAMEFMSKFTLIDSEHYINNAMKNGQSVLAEGAQGTMLDVDFGTYPFVTSSNTTAAGACTGLGIAPNKVKEVYGIFKAYTTRVGSGPFPTELFDKVGVEMAKIGREFGAVTGRPRRCGWLDLVALKYTCEVNGVTQLNMMKGDVLSGFSTLKVCTAYKYKGETITHLPYNIEPENVTPIYTSFPCWKEDLTKMRAASEFPKELNQYIDFLEKELEIPINIVSVGPDRTQTIHR